MSGLSSRTQLLVLATHFARVLQIRSAPEVRGRSATLQEEGAGNAGCPMHPWSAQNAVVSHRFTGLNRHSLHNGFTVSFVLSPVTGLFCHRSLCGKIPHGLTPASGRQDHTTSPCAGNIIRLVTWPTPIASPTQRP